MNDAMRQLIADAAEGDPGELHEQETLDAYAKRKVFAPLMDPIQYDFEKWIETEDGQRVYHEVVRRCRLLKQAGHTHYGIGMLWEAIRYDYSIRLGPDHGFKMNNNYRSRMARFVMDSHPSLKGFFETRRLR